MQILVIVSDCVTAIMRPAERDEYLYESLYPSVTESLWSAANSECLRGFLKDFINIFKNY